MWLYLGWVAAAFMVGFSLASWLKQRRPNLRQYISQTPVFRGKTYAEILREVGIDPQMAVHKTDGHILRTWHDHSGYSISLLFDANDLCLGVEDELIRGE